MGWLDIAWELQNDEMIKSCGCDGLIDAYFSLKGLYHMFELRVELTDEFILDVLNRAIDGRNRYRSSDECNLNYVKLENGEFIWEQ